MKEKLLRILRSRTLWGAVAMFFSPELGGAVSTVVDGVNAGDASRMVMGGGLLLVFVGRLLAQPIFNRQAPSP